MAIYHLHVKVIGRKSGSSAVASAAYRSASRLRDDRLERSHDFSNQTGRARRPASTDPSSTAPQDGAPDQLFAFLDYKTKLAGGSLKRFDPHGTSQACAACGARVPKTLAVRIHRCSCGFQAHRDTNAACNG